VTEHATRFATLEKSNKTQPYVNDSAYVFDAMWTAALALNRTESQLKERNLTLTDFTYNDKYNISDIIYEEARKLEFFGLTVSIYVPYNCVCTCMHVCICKDISPVSQFHYIKRKDP